MHQRRTQWEWIVPGKIVQKRSVLAFDRHRMYQSILYRTRPDTDLEAMVAGYHRRDRRAGIIISISSLSILVAPPMLVLLAFLLVLGEISRVGAVLVAASLAAPLIATMVVDFLDYRHRRRHFGPSDCWWPGEHSELSLPELQELAREWAGDRRINLAAGRPSFKKDFPSYYAIPVGETEESFLLAQSGYIPIYRASSYESDGPRDEKDGPVHSLPSDENDGPIYRLSEDDDDPA